MKRIILASAIGGTAGYFFVAAAHPELPTPLHLTSGILGFLMGVLVIFPQRILEFVGLPEAIASGTVMLLYLVLMTTLAWKLLPEELD